MPVTRVGSIELCYERIGADDGEPLLLVMGLRRHLIDWEVGFCRMLVERGFSVVRFDNRDSGLSTKTRGWVPTFVPAPDGGQPRLARRPPYTLGDMAADAVGLLDALGIGSAHVVGASLGGMIAQHLAFDHAHRVRSLTSIMSTTGDPTVGPPKLDAAGAVWATTPSTRSAAIEQLVEISRIISGPLWDEAHARVRVSERYDRGSYPVGGLYQLAALVADGDRTERLRDVRCPTLVIHGRHDPLIGVEAGIATAAAVPGAELLVLDEMGHDLPEPLWPLIVEAIASLAARAPAPG